MSFYGYADFHRPFMEGAGAIYYPFGGGPFIQLPHRCSLADAGGGRADFRLDLVRGLMPEQNYGILEMRLVADYGSEQALAELRLRHPPATLSRCVLTNWAYRPVPEPAMSDLPLELLNGAQLASDGLGSARLVQRLTPEGGLILEALLRDRTFPVYALAEAQMMGVSPRLSAAVRFRESELLGALLESADGNGVLSYEELVQFFRQDLASLPLEFTGQYESDYAFAATMADRVIDRFGSYLMSTPEMSFPVRLWPADEPGETDVRWSLAQPFLATRRVEMRFDLLADVRQRIAQSGLDAYVTRTTAAALPSLGESSVTVFCNLPAQRVGLGALGATLVFPANPPNRPQARTVTTLFEPPADIVEVPVRLAPGEALAYEYSTFAVLDDETGTHQVDSPATPYVGSPLRLSPEDFPIDFVLIEMTADLARLAYIGVACTYKHEGKPRMLSFRLDSDHLSSSVALPQGYEELRIWCNAVGHNGAGQLRIGPLESPHIRLDLFSFPEYGPHEVEIECAPGAGRTIYAIDLLAAGLSETPENITTLAFTPEEPKRRFSWFARSPFNPGFLYRPHRDGAPTPWWIVATLVERLVIDPGQPPPQEEKAAVAVSESAPARLSRLGRPGPASEVSQVIIERLPEGVPISPQPSPTDQLLYSHPADEARKLYIPEYRLDEQVVSGQLQYRISMSQQGQNAILTVLLVKGPPASLGESARRAEEFPHEITIELEFMQSPPSTARKTLEFEKISRNQDVITASLTFASLQERDEVYRALTESNRDARLTVKRAIDVAIPVDALPPSRIPRNLWFDDKLNNILLEPKPVTAHLNTMILAAPMLSFNEATPLSGVINVAAMMPVLAAQPAIPPLHAAVAVIDKPWLGDMVILDPVFPVVDPPPPTAPLHKEIHVVLNQPVQPAPFNFPPALHSYIFQGITPGSDGGGLTLYRLPWKAPSTSHTVFHTYLQDKSRPDRVLFFPDQFKIARTQELPLFKPYITVRVASTAGLVDPDIVFDYIVAPYTDPRRLIDARRQLLDDPRFGANEVKFQPFETSDVRFIIDRPTKQGTSREERTGVSLLLQGGLKDTLVMKTGDFLMIFDAMHKATASLFLGRVEIDVPNENSVVIPFTARLGDLAGDIFLFRATENPDDSIGVSLTNAIESPIRIDALGAQINRDGQSVRGLIQGASLPIESLAAGATVQMTITPETPLAGSGMPEVRFNLDAVSVIPDPAAALDAILDRTTQEYFDEITVKVIPTSFEPGSTCPNDQIVEVLVEFENGGTADLIPANPESKVRIDYPIDDVVLGRPIDNTYRYSVTVIRADGTQERDPASRTGTARVLVLSVNKCKG